MWGTSIKFLSLKKQKKNCIDIYEKNLIKLKNFKFLKIAQKKKKYSLKVTPRPLIAILSIWLKFQVFTVNFLRITTKKQNKFCRVFIHKILL